MSPPSIISERIVCRRDNFVAINMNCTLLRHGETTNYSQGRRTRVSTVHRDRSAWSVGWKANLTIHQPHIFFSDLKQHNTDTTNLFESINKFLHPENFADCPTQSPSELEPLILTTRTPVSYSMSDQNTQEWKSSPPPPQSKWSSRTGKEDSSGLHSTLKWQKIPSEFPPRCNWLEQAGTTSLILARSMKTRLRELYLLALRDPFSHIPKGVQALCPPMGNVFFQDPTTTLFLWSFYIVYNKKFNTLC